MATTEEQKDGTVPAGPGEKIESKSHVDDSQDYGEHFDFYSEGDEILSQAEESEKPTLKEQNFEFTSSINMMRVTRLIICLQVLGLAIDSPAIQLPIVFRIVCRLMLFYSTKFYSRPVIDMMYLWQWIRKRLPSSIDNIIFAAPTVPEAPVTSGVTAGVRRWLASSRSDYVIQPQNVRVIEATYEFLEPRTWHAVKNFSHFFLSALAVGMFFLFTLKFWEIKDYTDRRDVRQWLARNIADGWWRRGLAVFTWSMIKGLLFMGCFALLMFAMARQFNVNSTPTASMLGGAVAIFASTVGVIYTIGYIGMKASESVFVRYVSQNVSYTSSIILKRVVKSKVDIGIMLMFMVYMPALRAFAEGCFIITDWNDTLSFDYRRTINYYTPCYLMAFPPYHEPNIDPGWCPVHYSISADQPQRAEGYYEDRQILSCDSYLGISFWTVSFLFFWFTAIGYAWVYWEFVDTCVRELRGSRWVGTLHTLISIRNELQTHYVENFHITQRLTLDLTDEIMWQLAYIYKAVRWILKTTISSVWGIIKLCIAPFYIMFSPCLFIGTRVFLLFCTCFTKPVATRSEAQIERDRIKAEEEFLKNMGDSMSYHESMSLLKELSVADTLGEEEELANFQTRIANCGYWIYDTANVFKYPYRWGSGLLKSLDRYWTRNPSMINLRLNIRQCIRAITCKKETDVGLAQLGGAGGGWRLARSITARVKKIRVLDIRITEELRVARQDFTSDHALAITVLDRVIDTSGLFMLISQYHYHRLYWTMVLWAEMTIYSLLSAYSNYYLEWKQRLELIAVINIFFGFLTYLCKPFTEDTDRWLDFLGRILVGGTLFGIVYCNEQLPNGANDEVPAFLYKPLESFEFLKSVEPVGGATYVMIDCLMTTYMLGYIFNVLEVAGFFAVTERAFRSFLYGMHDHILDYLINNLEKRAIGRENIFEGLLLVQQWDDVVIEQRRYALLTFPDVRPSDLVPLSIKLIEIKWAAFFNLTLKNIRSSLGLSILHTSMCAADSEVARWLIHMHPELLNAEDFQRDTPVFIALKECSYFLLKYGDQNNGKLDDGTGYDDEKFLSCYPEIEDLRYNAMDQGEYIASLGDVLNLDAFELRSLGREFHFVETKNDHELKKYRPSFLTFKSKLSKFATQEEIEAEKLEKEAWENLAGGGDAPVKEKTPQELRDEQKAEQKLAALEKASLYRKRFPEDDFQDNYESGQMAAWAIIGLSVPDSNLFIDPLFANFADTGFENKKHGETGDEEAPEEEERPPEAAEENEYLIKDEGDMDSENGARGSQASGNGTPPRKLDPDEMQAGPDDYYDDRKTLDMRYNVKSLRFPELPDKFAHVVPNGHPALQEMQDWDIIRRKKRIEARTILGSMHDAKQAIESTAGWMLGRVTFAQKQEKDREVRFKMCKFAEILLSEEIQENCKNIQWDINNYKALNMMSSKAQGRIAQNLAMSCNINPPAGFTRLSEWTSGISINVFDEFPYEEFHFLVNAAVTVASSTAIVKNTLAGVIPKLPYGNGKKKAHDILLAHANKRANDHPDQEDGFNDRIIHYLAECYCACRQRLDFTDCELTFMGRNGWRAISRALRRNNCTFIIPSMFVATRQILTTHLNLSRNELDDGDAVLLSDIVLYKQTLISLDLSHNRIGARGLIRMCKAMKGHQNIKVLVMSHNRVGPAAGRELGIWLQACNTLEVLDLSYNRLGELVQYPTPICRQRVASAARDLFGGMKRNRGLQILNLAYNHLGPVLAEVVPISIMKHPHLSILDLSGNDLGAKAGASLIFALGMNPGGDHEIEQREQYYRELKEKQLLGIDVVAEEAAKVAEEQKAAALAASRGLVKKEKKKKKMVVTGDEENKIISKLAYIGLNDNQLGRMAGFGIASMLVNSKTLTSLDVSGNNLGYDGGVALADGLEKVYKLVPRDFFKRSLYDLEEQTYQGRNAKVRKVIYTNLTNLNLSQNGLGPTCCQGLMYCMANKNCTITSLDLSRNPLGYTIENGGNAMLAGQDMRTAISSSMSMTHLNLSRTHFLPVDMVPLLGALNRNRALKRLIITDSYLDEPSCLQLAHGVSSCPTLVVVDVHNTRMGPKGGLMLVNRLDELGKRLTYLDISGNGIGPIACIPIGAALEDRECTLRTMYLQGNDLMDEGGAYVIKGMKLNISLTDVDLSANSLTGEIAEILADVARGLFVEGKKLSDCQLKRLCVSDNPQIGMTGAKLLIKAMTSTNFTHIELANIGAGPGTGKIIAAHIRDVALKWVYCDIEGNALSRPGLNEIFWAMRQNRSLRVFKCGDNKAGSVFGSDQDALLGHGIALQRTIKANVVLRELDLSYNGMSPNACINVFEAMCENYTIRKLCMRGNKMDDIAAESLSNLLRINNTCDDLDLGENMLGFDCCHVLGEGIEVNRALKSLSVDSNQLNAAGNMPIKAFMQGICLNTSLRVLIMDGNSLGSEWGYQLAGALSRNNTLVQVSFRDNHLDDRAGQALLKAFTHAPFLLELALTADEIGTTVWDEFKRVFSRKRSVVDPSHEAQETLINERNTKILSKYYFESELNIH